MPRETGEIATLTLPELLRMFGEPGGDRASAGPPSPEWETLETDLFREFQRLWHESPHGTDQDLEELASQYAGTLIPDEPVPIRVYERELLRKVVARSVHTDSPKFIGHMTSALPGFLPLFARLVVALNQNQVKTETARATTPFERQAIGMLHRVTYGRSEDFYAEHVQNIESALGLVTTGGTTANLAALWSARNRALPADGDFGGIEVDGLPAALSHSGLSGAVIVGSELMHYSFKKIAGLLGIGAKSLLTVPAGTDNRIDLGLLRRRLSECRESGKRVLSLVGIAGTTETGSVDPLDAMADLAAEHRVHFHVDAAWGGPTLFSEKHRGRLAGIERADSVTIDGHKQLYVPLGIGLVLFRDPDTARSIEQQARYTIRAGSGDLGRRSIEGSRPAMVLYLHAALHLIGRRGYAMLIDEGIRKTAFLADEIRRRAAFELLAEPELNILVYRYLPERHRAGAREGRLDDAANREINDLNEALQKLQGRAGHSFVSRTALETTPYGRELPIVALRAVLANPLTTDSDMSSVLDEQETLGATLVKEPAAASR